MSNTSDASSGANGFTSEPNDVLQAEREHLLLKEGMPASGLAISGGGIRSASFGMGVMQALVNNNVLKHIDYMSTVSGGGYLGSALTWALSQRDKPGEDGKPIYGTTPENFPLGKRGTHREKRTILAKEEAHEDDNQLLDYIRQHGNYLTPTRRLDMLSFLPVVLRSMTISLAVYLGVITVVMTGMVWLLYNMTGRVHDLRGSEMHPAGVLLYVGVALFLVIVAMGIPYSISTFTKIKHYSKYRYRVFVYNQAVMGVILRASLVCLLLGSLPFTLRWIGEGLELPTSSTIFGALVGIWQYIKAQKKDATVGVKSDILIYLGAFGLIYGLLLFAYKASTWFLDMTTFEFVHLDVFGVVVLATALLGFLANLNLIGPHHLWRSRLMETFMPGREAVTKNRWELALDADAGLMQNMCDSKNPRPYHIINTNVILPNSRQVDYSNRGGDNFIISRLYCGSDATGWRKTEQFQNKTGRGMTLATAMATSAAALNPNAAVSGEGMTRNVVISLLLSLLNLRLGYWTGNPRKEKEPWSPPNFFMPGLWSEILRKGMDEQSRYIQLSDGGHYENLALYELIRRKLGLIIASDGGADATFNFDDLANVVEKVRVDFGAKISFIKEYALGNILPGTLKDTDFQKKYGIAKYGYAVARIDYADGSKGILYYMKLAMIEDMATDVFSYKGVNPSFPHQSTSDQFFDEKQFEAYRELGYYIAWQLMDSEKVKDLFNAEGDKAAWLANLRSAFNERHSPPKAWYHLPRP